jgi:UDP-GlcNAc3NAcA epimerase
MITIVTVVGARPQFIKASALSNIFASKPDVFREKLVHTGQHYAPELSAVFFEQLALPPPSYHLDVGSGLHGEQTGAMLARIERVLIEERPHVVLVYGDTNSTLAGALAASKLKVPIAHVEAGLRSFNRAMPEEINRVVTDHLAALHFCPTRTAVGNLAREGIVSGVTLVGDVMYDVAIEVGKRAETASRFAKDASLSHRGYALATIHRAENTDDDVRLRCIVGSLARLAEKMPVLLPAHPRTRSRIDELELDTGQIRVIDPLGIIDMAYLERHAAVIVTDSGGVQKEAYFHRTPCVTVRTETEWVETVEAGWNRLASPSDTGAISKAIEDALAAPPPATSIADYGSGDAGQVIADAIAKYFE